MHTPLKISISNQKQSIPAMLQRVKLKLWNFEVDTLGFIDCMFTDFASNLRLHNLRYRGHRYHNCGPPPCWQYCLRWYR